MLKFITSNKTKFTEISSQLKPIELKMVQIELAEIQEIDSKKVIEYKLKEALEYHRGEFIIDDTSVYLKALNYKLPGPFIKWFLSSMGETGFANFTKRLSNATALAKTIIGYAKSPGDIQYFEGVAVGKIVTPRGNYHFGFDPIFQPKGSNLTLAEMKLKKNFAQSPRGLAVKKLRNYLLKAR